MAQRRGIRSTTGEQLYDQGDADEAPRCVVWPMAYNL
jgi:hypothetical protein